METIKIIDIVGNAFCVSAADGQKVYEVIYPMLKNGQRVEVSFENIDLMISAFLNVAIGQLYGSLSADVVRNQLSTTNLCNEDCALLQHVVDNAKQYFEKKKPYDETVCI